MLCTLDIVTGNNIFGLLNLHLFSFEAHPVQDAMLAVAPVAGISFLYICCFGALWNSFYTAGVIRSHWHLGHFRTCQTYANIRSSEPHRVCYCHEVLDFAALGSSPSAQSLLCTGPAAPVLSHMCGAQNQAQTVKQ